MLDIKNELEKYNLDFETYESILQDCSNKAKKVNGFELDWADIVEKYNLDIHYDSLRKATQTIFGSAFTNEYFKWKESQQRSATDDKYLKELIAQQQELRKEKRKLFDERRELNKLIDAQGRKESFLEMVGRIISENIEPYEFKTNPSPAVNIDSDNSMIIHLTDLHTGIGINNYFNKFNNEILEQRLDDYLENIFKIQKLHNSSEAYIIISEIVSGLIHETLRIENNEDVISQFKTAAQYISGFIHALSEKFDKVHIYVTPGNHSRLSPKKELSLKGENLDNLLPFYLNAKFQNSKNVFIYENFIDSEIAEFNVRGNIVQASHGDKDSPVTVVQKFTMMTGIQPDLVYLGHRHTNGLTTVYDTKVIESGCVSGTDNYAINIRRTNKPEQTVSIINKNGLVCLYDVALN